MKISEKHNSVFKAPLIYGRKWIILFKPLNSEYESFEFIVNYVYSMVMNISAAVIKQGHRENSQVIGDTCLGLMRDSHRAKRVISSI